MTSRVLRPLSLKPYDSDKRFIKGELGAHEIKLVFLEDDYNPDGLSIMATFKTPDSKGYRVFAHTEKFPLRNNWMARAVANLRFARERA